MFFGGFSMLSSTISTAAVWAIISCFNLVLMKSIKVFSYWLHLSPCEIRASCSGIGTWSATIFFSPSTNHRHPGCSRVLQWRDVRHLKDFPKIIWSHLLCLLWNSFLFVLIYICLSFSLVSFDSNHVHLVGTNGQNQPGQQGQHIYTEYQNLGPNVGLPSPYGGPKEGQRPTLREPLIYIPVAGADGNRVPLIKVCNIWIWPDTMLLLGFFWLRIYL